VGPRSGKSNFRKSCPQTKLIIVRAIYGEMGWFERDRRLGGVGSKVEADAWMSGGKRSTKKKTTDDYHQPTVHNAPNVPLRTVRTNTIMTCAAGVFVRAARGIAPFATAAKVVANGLVGCAEPLTVTVAASWAEVAEAVGVEPAARIVNRGDVACMTPCVELMKIRK